MGIALEKRLRKLETAEEAKMDKLRIDHEAVMRREAYEKLTSTPQSRAVLRAYCEQRFRATWAEERKRIEAVTRPEQLRMVETRRAVQRRAKRST
jgi:hypothetical protein